MKKNPYAFQFVKLKPTKGYRVAVETSRTGEGCFEAATYLFDTDQQEWFAIGNADDIARFPSRIKAFRHGLEILREASLY